MLDPGVAPEIADWCGLGAEATLTGPVARGELGQIWKLETSFGRWAVKEPFDRVSEPEAEEGAAFQDAARRAGVPTPGVVRGRDGEVLLAVGPGQLSVQTWVDLREPTRELDPVAIGSLVAALHLVPFAGRQPVDPWYVDPVGAARWEELVVALDAAGAPFAVRLGELRDELVAVEQLLAPPRHLRTCHRDLFADNLRVTADGDLCVIDWDNCGLADPGQELAVVLYEFGDGEPGRARALYDAYRACGGPGRIEEPSDFSMLVAQIGHLGERAVQLWLEADSPPAREDCVGRVEEFLGDPVTRARIDGLLDAISS